MLFLYNRDTGTLETAIELDFDLAAIQRFFTLNISVDDTRFTDYLTVNINVIDINDNFPEFANESYRCVSYLSVAIAVILFFICSFTIEEQLPVGSVVGQVQAEDIDSGTFGQIEYSLSGPTVVTDRYIGALHVAMHDLSYS